MRTTITTIQIIIISKCIRRPTFYVLALNVCMLRTFARKRKNLSGDGHLGMWDVTECCCWRNYYVIHFFYLAIRVAAKCYWNFVSLFECNVSVCRAPNGCHNLPYENKCFFFFSYFERIIYFEYVFSRPPQVLLPCSISFHNSSKDTAQRKWRQMSQMCPGSMRTEIFSSQVELDFWASH